VVQRSAALASRRRRETGREALGGDLADTRVDFVGPVTAEAPVTGRDDRPTRLEIPTSGHATRRELPAAPDALDQNALEALEAGPSVRDTAPDLRVATPVPTAGRVEHPSQQVQRYADGVSVHFGGDENIGAATRVVTLPYRSDEVTLRLDRYDLLNELGRGGMGVVYRAYALHLDRFCAVKLMTAGMHAGEVATIRFQNEARIASCLKHDAIVSIFDSGTDEQGRLYFVMEYVEGEDLASFSDRTGQQRTAVTAIAKAARALQYAHDKGVVHRDIKSDNILVDGAGNPHITDFGIAHREQDAGLTQDGFAMGTPAFMSPEQANGEVATIGPATDIWSLGATLYDVLAGRPPFQGDSVWTVMSDVVNREPERPSVIAAEKGREAVPLDLETICLKALEKDVAARYPTMAAFADDLEAWLDDRPISARPISGVERLRKLIRRNRAAFVGATLVGLTLMVLTLSFGAVLIFNVERTSDSLTELDTEAGIAQAVTLEKAIRTNMLQGRADVVRELVDALRKEPGIASIDVVRPDRSYAYTDRSTRVKVEQRLQDAAVLAKIAAERPEMAARIEDLKRIGFGAIDRNATPPGKLFDHGRDAWNALVEAGRTEAMATRVDERPMLTVFKPIENSAECQTCHGGIDEAGYDHNRVRAVLVVRRSQEGLEAQIAKNRTDTIVIGSGTAVLLLLIAAIFARLTGISLPKRRFSAARGK
jgi:serine/threonine protein kinase